MTISEWITADGISMAEAARRCGIGGVNPSRTLDRVAKGERPADADLIARIKAASGGRVTVDDMHATRLAWLRENKPERFGGTPAGGCAELPEAAQ